MKKSEDKKETAKTCKSSCPQCSKQCSLSAEHIGSHRCPQGHRWK